MQGEAVMPLHLHLEDGERFSLLYNSTNSAFPPLEFSFGGGSQLLAAAAPAPLLPFNLSAWNYSQVTLGEPTRSRSGSGTLSSSEVGLSRSGTLSSSASGESSDALSSGIGASCLRPRRGLTVASPERHSERFFLCRAMMRFDCPPSWPRTSRSGEARLSAPIPRTSLLGSAASRATTSAFVSHTATPPRNRRSLVPS